jgi:ABC-2 type transport system ATP-binding protein
MAEAEHVTYRIAVIDHGRIVAEGTAAALREQTGGRTLEDAFIALTGHSIREDEAAPIATACAAPSCALSDRRRK